MKRLLTKLKTLTKKQKIVIFSCLGALIVSLSVGIVVYQYQKQQALMEQQKAKEQQDSIILEESEEAFVEEVVEDVVEEAPPQIQTISMTGSSIERDLKIKIINEQKKLVSGGAFVITVTSNGSGHSQQYNDHDQDGIIYIKSIDAGQYAVQLHEIEGYSIVKNSIVVTVKDKIEYKKVDVVNEIKQATEVNIQQEDKPVEKPKEEVKIVDTVKLVDSTKKENVVKKQDVDLTQMPKASASENQDPIIIHNQTTIKVPDSVVLYDAKEEDARNFTLKYEVLDEENIIESISLNEDKNGVFTATEKVKNKETVLTAVKKGESTLYLTVKYKVTTLGAPPVEEGQPKVEGRTSTEEKPEVEEGKDPEEKPEVEEEKDPEKQPEVENKTETQEIRIKVSVLDYKDHTTQLKDKNGNPLYVDKDAQKPATWEDYHTKEQLYTTPTYTGWQKIGDSTYYFDENHKPVTGVQVIGGARYHFGEDGKLLKSQEQRGIDVSKWQGNIDWSMVASAGIDFAIIRVGNRGSTTGVLIEDPYFKKNMEGTIAAGIKVGVYLYSQAITEAEAVEEASMAISLVKDYKLQLPIYFDTEKISGGRANNLSVTERTAITKAFCETIRNAGYMPGIYSNYYWLRDKLNMSELERYSVWVAHYSDKCGYPGKYDMWQYTSSGSVPGIKGNVDMNISYVGY